MKPLPRHPKHALRAAIFVNLAQVDWKSVMKFSTNTAIAATAAMMLGSAGQAEQQPTNPNYVVYPDPNLIQRDLGGLGWVLRRNYDKYIDYKTPNGGSVPLVATDDVGDEQLMRAYNILDFYLTDVPGTQYGADKSTVANAMAANGAVLVMPGGSDGNSPIWSWALAGQPLYQLEFPVEGSPAYINNDFEQRDAGFEEIFHMVHDYGIGTRFTDGALKDSYQVELADATASAIADARWAIAADVGVDDWIEELRKEGSLQQEYIVSVIDSFYGLWGPWTEASGGMWGIYIAKTREETKWLDPLGTSVLRKFLPDQMTYMARIDPTFQGTFEMTFDPEEPYTYKSQYLLNARLLGDLSSNLLGNDHDNVLIGNTGDNVLDGGGGVDVVQFPILSSEVVLSAQGDSWIAVSQKFGRDMLIDIETLRFLDKDVELVD